LKHITQEMLNDFDIKEITQDEIIVKKLNIDWGKGETDPVSQVYFYNYHDQIRNIKKEEVSHIIPAEFSKSLIRIYAKNKAHLPVIKKAFNILCEEKNKNTKFHSYEKSNSRSKSIDNFKGVTGKKLFQI